VIKIKIILFQQIMSYEKVQKNIQHIFIFSRCTCSLKKCSKDQNTGATGMSKQNVFQKVMLYLEYFDFLPSCLVFFLVR